MKKEFVLSEYALNVAFNTEVSILCVLISMEFEQYLSGLQIQYVNSYLYSHKMIWIDQQLWKTRMFESMANSNILPAGFQVFIVKQNASTEIKFNIQDLFIAEDISVIHRSEFVHGTKLVNSIVSFNYCLFCTFR